MSFSVSSPDLEALADGMDAADPVTAYYRAAADVGGQFEPLLAQAFDDAEASEGLLDTIGTYIHPSGLAYVGIPNTSRHINAALEHEHGTPFRAPAAPVRNTVAANKQEFGQKFSAALDRELGAEVAGK